VHVDAYAAPGVETVGLDVAVRAGDAIAPDARPAETWQRVKRPLDFVLALVFLILLAPLLLAITVAVLATSSGPVLFRQRRIGRDLREFTMLKFRTMHDGVSDAAHRALIADLAAGHTTGEGLRKLTADPRVTGVGRLLRKTSLDELPQLLNVLTGTMSLIGPRPAIPYELEHYEARHYERFQVRPGLTGLWQVSGRAAVGFVEMLDIDVEYVRRANALTDLAITARTPIAVLPRRTA
jgi:lipopolysaccharide/colanic/teichoic acid biosynthesis glycosyltransferase